jgi:hypothetical protein
MTNTEAEVVAAWKEAAADLGIQFTTPFVVTLPDGHRQEHLGLVHHFGRRLGTLVSVLHEPSEKFPRPEVGDYFWSVLGSSYSRYDRQEFIDTLDDWQFFGTESERPKWYSGKSWGAWYELSLPKV